MGTASTIMKSDDGMVRNRMNRIPMLAVDRRSANRFWAAIAESVGKMATAVACAVAALVTAAVA